MNFEDFFNKSEFHGLDLTLNRIDSALKAARFDSKRLGRVIHIAGTNGKGSTSTYLATLLRHRGYNVGLFTSPHILAITERINFNGKDIEPGEIEEIFTNHKEIIATLSYFEAIFFIACIYFSKKNLDVAILETGMGGRFDATNTSLIEEKVAVITKLGLDHTVYLGDTIYKIADEKLGIARNGSALIIALNNKRVSEYILKNYKKYNPIFLNKSSFKECKKIYKNLFKDKPSPYDENLYTAITIFKTFFNKDNDLNIIDSCKVSNPQCRMERIGNFILDGSHNLDGLMAIKKTFQKANISLIIYSCTNDREPAINILREIAENIIVTTIPNNSRSISATEIEKMDKEILFIKDPALALKFAKEKHPNGNILICGSFYLCGYMKRLL